MVSALELIYPYHHTTCWNHWKQNKIFYFAEIKWKPMATGNLRTDLVRDVNICGATTNLWIPSKKRQTDNEMEKKNIQTIELVQVQFYITKYSLNSNVAQVNMGWFNKDSVSGTTDVLGSVSQYQAPIEVLIDIIVSTTERNTFIRLEITIEKMETVTYCAIVVLMDSSRLLLPSVVAQMPLDLK